MKHYTETSQLLKDLEYIIIIFTMYKCIKQLIFQHYRGFDLTSLSSIDNMYELSSENIYIIAIPGFIKF